MVVNVASVAGFVIKSMIGMVVNAVNVNKNAIKTTTGMGANV